MICPNENIIAPGDVLLTTSEAKISKAIRVATGSKISHAMLCVAHSSVIDATNEGVQARNIQRLLYPDGATIVLLRPRHPLTSDELALLTGFARAQVGTQYDVRDALATRLARRGPASRKQFCSRLVGQAYAAAGRVVVDAPDFCAPEDLRRSSAFIEITDCTRIVSAGEQAARAARPDPTERMRAAQNQILNGARALDSSVQQFTDLYQLVVDRPDLDHAIAALHQEAGYLDLWRLDLIANPQAYDLALLQAWELPAEEKAAYCRQTLVSEAEMSRRFEGNRAVLSAAHRAQPRRTFALLIELEELLLRLSAKRASAAKAWLESSSVA